MFDVVVVLGEKVLFPYIVSGFFASIAILISAKFVEIEGRSSWRAIGILILSWLVSAIYGLTLGQLFPRGMATFIIFILPFIVGAWITQWLFKTTFKKAFIVNSVAVVIYTLIQIILDDAQFERWFM